MSIISPVYWGDVESVATVVHWCSSLPRREKALFFRRPNFPLMAECVVGKLMDHGAIVVFLVDRHNSPFHTPAVRAILMDVRQGFHL